MPLFVVTIEYTRPLSEIEAARPDHRAFLRTLHEAGKLVASGPFVPPTGGMLLLKAANKTDAEAMLSPDPFQTRNLAGYAVREWSPVLGAERLV